VIIGVSASGSSQLRQESLAAGCNDFLAKPLRIENLLECLHRYLGLEWLYEDIARTESEQQQAFETFPIPSEDVLMDLLELAKGGYIDDIQELTARLKASDSNFIPFASRIEELAEKIQFKQIIDVITSSLKNE
jgi:DNA-binding NtrC family response regulator